MLPPERQFRRSSEKTNVESAAQATAELASKAGEERQARDTAAEATESEDWRLNLETAQKAGEERLHALPLSARMSHSSRKLQLVHQAASQRPSLKRRSLGVKELMAHQVPLKLQHGSDTHGWPGTADGPRGECLRDRGAEEKNVRDLVLWETRLESQECTP